MVTLKTADNNFATAKWIVNSVAGLGTHTTIAAALTSSASGDTIFLMPGTYTENLTMKAGVNLTANVCDATTPNVTINGTVTCNHSGVNSFSGINFQTNGAASISVTGANVPQLYITNCEFNAAVPAIVMSSSGGASAHIFGCILTSSDAIFQVSGACGIRFDYCTVVGSVASTNSGSGGTVIVFSQYNNAITTSNTASMSIFQCICTLAGGTFTCGGSALHTIDLTYISSGAGSAITITNGGTNVAKCVIATSNTNAIAGNGTLNYGNITFTGTSSLIAVTLTATPFVTST